MVRLNWLVLLMSWVSAGHVDGLELLDGGDHLQRLEVRVHVGGFAGKFVSRGFLLVLGDALQVFAGDDRGLEEAGML